MCGIVGYLGPNNALPIIIEGLEKLEYRGYDSAGVALYSEGRVDVTRTIGKLSALKDAIGKAKPKHSNLGIGHTRWATHGKPSENNAHPHTAGRVSLIHNGIIENYLELRKELEREGRKFSSETDTEIVAHLLDKHLAQGQAPFDALKTTCGRIRGAYAFVCFDSKNPDRLLVAKNATPIVIGAAKDEVFVASDFPAILNHTRDMIVLEDGDIAELKIGSMQIENCGQKVDRPIRHINWDPVTAQKGGFKHYMLKEIHDQPQALADTVLGRIDHKTGEIAFDELNLSAAEIGKIDRIVLVACGTAWHACLLGKFYFEKFAQIPCEVDYASEFRYRSPVLNRNTLVIAVSQSGETADTLGAIELAGKSAQTMAVCNVLGSSLTRKAQNTVFTRAGPEISVASTKAFTTQVATLILLASYFAQKRGVAHQALELAESLLHLPRAMEECLKCEEEVLRVARQHSGARDFLYIARGHCYPVALEGALKLKEISYIHAEGYPAGEMKHGPIALISEEVPIVVIIPRSEQLYEKTFSNLREAEARGGKLIILTDVADVKELNDLSEYVIQVPHISELLSPLLCSVPLQFLAYHIAVLNGTDVDQPRNLAKSVTVE